MIKTLSVGNDFIGDVPLTKKILAALTKGALAITVANPTDLVKVRLQAEGKLPPGAPRRTKCVFHHFETVGDLWTGIAPNIARNAIINAAELASYDQVKQTLLEIPGFKDNIVAHLFAGLGVKSRMMGDSSAYKKTIDCFVKTLKNDYITKDLCYCIIYQRRPLLSNSVTWPSPTFSKQRLPSSSKCQAKLNLCVQALGNWSIYWPKDSYRCPQPLSDIYQGCISYPKAARESGRTSERNKGKEK
ncbi:putative mitochondrial carrier domain-containing protein [Rosa chinensis]|uniref:Putative mitochondrial carrier domain-containing protein n=1 Tax=Rosa chinensis TaxID=74649 RepID=A0A2P6S843_ROSCH|nr:putative mitochondrial carrier domain-containing protein [Rosa chinensis]